MWFQFLFVVINQRPNALRKRSWKCSGFTTHPPLNIGGVRTGNFFKHWTRFGQNSFYSKFYTWFYWQINHFLNPICQKAIIFYKLTLLFYKWLNNFEKMLAFIFVRWLRIRLRRCRVAVLLSERISGQRSVRGQMQFARFASSEKHRLGNWKRSKRRIDGGQKPSRQRWSDIGKREQALAGIVEFDLSERSESSEASEKDQSGSVESWVLFRCSGVVIRWRKNEIVVQIGHSRS